MKTCKQLSFVFIFMLFVNQLWAYDFKAINGENTFYFKITSFTVPYTVSITSEITHSPYYIDTTTTPRGFLDIPTTVTYNAITYTVNAISDYAFNNCDDITSISIPNTITSIGNNAFEQCKSFSTLTIPNSVTNIGKWAFHWCSGLVSLELPSNIDTMKIGAFAFTNLCSLTIPNSVIYIDSQAFFDCNISTLIIPNSVKTICYEAFSSCFLLTSITLGNAINYIGDKAFYYCTSLLSLTCKASIPPVLDSLAFLYSNTASNVFVPCNTKTIYETDKEWRKFTKIKEKFLFTITTKSNNTDGGRANATIPECTNSTCSIIATAYIDYKFIQWNDGNTDNPRIVKVTQDTMFTAYFALDDAIIETGNIDEILVYPNPTTNQFSIEYGQQTIQEVSIYDIVGKEIVHLTINDSKASINAEPWQSGIYFIKILTVNGTITSRIIRK